jgi:hypothetical protein
VNIKAFFVAALQSALDTGMAVTDDILRHVTPDLLAAHLPRPLWARLLTACVGAPKVDATLVVETVGVANLCEHIPSPVIWSCLAEIGARSLGGEIPIAKPRFIPAATPPPINLAAPPPEVAPAKTATAPSSPVGPSIPAPSEALNDVFADLERDEKTVAAPTQVGGPQPARARTPTGQRFRPNNTGIGRLANAPASGPSTPPPPAGGRRPQAIATEPNPTVRPARRGATEVSEYDVETNVGQEEWKNALAVDDEQLVDWSSAEEKTTGDDYDPPKKR